MARKKPHLGDWVIHIGDGPDANGDVRLHGRIIQILPEPKQLAMALVKWNEGCTALHMLEYLITIRRDLTGMIMWAEEQYG